MCGVVSIARIIFIEAKGSGIAFFDYDQDGWLDIYLTNGTRLNTTWPPGQAPTTQLYHNNRDGTFTDVTAKSGLARTGWQPVSASAITTTTAGTTCFAPFGDTTFLFHNNGDGTFTDVTKQAGLWKDEVRWGSGCTWLDYDRDGFLDLFVANYIAFDIAKVPAPGQTMYCQFKGNPVMCGPRGLPGGNAIFSTTTTETAHLPMFPRRRGFSSPGLAIPLPRCLMTSIMTAGQTSTSRWTPSPASCFTIITMEHLPISRLWRVALIARTGTSRLEWASPWGTTIAMAGWTSSRPIFPMMHRTSTAIMATAPLPK